MDSTSLMHRYLLGDLTDDEVKELDRLLANSPELRREFTLAAATDAGLREIACERAAEPVQLRTQAGTAKKYFWATCVSLAVAIVVMFAFGLGLFRQAPIATLVSSENAAWESSLPTTPSSELKPGLLKLKSGVATIRFKSGAEVVLEAPAELELMTPMRAKLRGGAAVVDVPESAIGFVIETPDGYAIDYGTRFAVRVDQQERQSHFEIIEGEIAVHHPETGDEVRLTGQGKAVTMSELSIEVVDLEQQEDTAPPSANVIRIGTNGRAGSAIRNNKRKRFIDREVLSVRTTKATQKLWDHRSFFAFDLSDVDVEPVRSARLRLNLVPSTHGLSSALPQINLFSVYGLTNPAKADWKIDSLWEESPGPEDGVLLGTFEIPRSQTRGTFGINDRALLEFLKKHREGEVTFIVVRETTQIRGLGPSLTHMFASDSHPESVGPTLELLLGATSTP